MQRILYRGCCFLLMLISLNLAVSLPAVAADGYMASVAKKMLAGIDKATWIQEGKNQHVVYIFFDPNCPYCHKLYQDTRDWVKRKAIEIRWIPVGVLTATSPGKAAAMLEAKDPLKAFYQDEEHYARGEGGGGIDETLMSTKTEAALKINVHLLRLSGIDAVPTILFRDGNGQPIIIQGAPSKDILRKIFLSQDK